MTPQSLIKIPGYDYYEYLLVITPHELLREKIMKERKLFANKFHISSFLKSTPHILLANFLQFERNEKQLISQLKHISDSFHPVSIELKGFGSFPSHTIYLNVHSQKSVHEITKALRSVNKLMTLNKQNRPHLITQSYITVAHKLSALQYDKAWPEYRERHFTGSFIANEITLLGRIVEPMAGAKYYTGQYNVIQNFIFKNTPVSDSQGILF